MLKFHSRVQLLSLYRVLSGTVSSIRLAVRSVQVALLSQYAVLVTLRLAFPLAVVPPPVGVLCGDPWVACQRGAAWIVSWSEPRLPRPQPFLVDLVSPPQTVLAQTWTCLVARSLGHVSPVDQVGR